MSTSGLIQTDALANSEKQTNAAEHVRFLRHKVDAGFRRKLLKTVYGYGYKLDARGEDCWPSDADAPQGLRLYGAFALRVGQGGRHRGTPTHPRAARDGGRRQENIPT